MNNVIALDTIVSHAGNSHATLAAKHAIALGLSRGDAFWLALDSLADQLRTSRAHSLPAPSCHPVTGFTALLDLASKNLPLRDAPLHTKALTTHPLFGT